MRIVQINAVYGFSSTGRTVLQLHEYLKSQGHESWVYYSVPTSDSIKEELIGGVLDHKVHALFSRLFGLQAYLSIIPTFKLIKKLKRISPNVVILRNFHSNYINLPMLAKYLARNDIPTIAVLHDCWFYTGHCCHYTEVGCMKWKEECHHCALTHSDSPSFFFDTSRKVFNDKRKLFGSIPRLAVVGVSDWIANEARQSPIFEKAAIIKRIYNWIDLNTFQPQNNNQELRNKFGFSNTDFVALGVSMSWSYKKGEGSFIELAKRMPKIKVLMVGEMTNDNLPANVINISPTSSVKELAELYSMADVFLNFSIQESFGKVAAEALACGTPLIVNNATANSEIPGDCGYVVENNDVEAIVKSVKEIREKGKAFYQQRCVERAKSLFDKDTNIEAYISLFQEIQIIKN